MRHTLTALAILTLGALASASCGGVNGSPKEPSATASDENGQGAINAAVQEITLGNQRDWPTYYAHEASEVRDRISFDDFASCSAALRDFTGVVTLSNLSAKDSGNHRWDVTYDGTLGNDPKHSKYRAGSSYLYEGGAWRFTVKATDISLFPYGQDCVQHIRGG